MSATSKFRSFRAEHGRDPIAGQDYSADAGLDQDEYEYLTGTGDYSHEGQRSPADEVQDEDPYRDEAERAAYLRAREGWDS